jgi:AcrR family transcriptional regulator
MPATRAKRADAVRNRAKVLAAAAQVLAERGVAASVPEIAAAAGVGKATVYRSFPTKEHLVAAIAIERLQVFRERCEAARETEDPTEEFAQILRDAARRQASDRLLVSAMAVIPELPELSAARTAVSDAMEELVSTAKASGGMRADATAEEIRVLFVGVGRILTESDEEDPDVWVRYADLVIDAMRPPRR